MALKPHLPFLAGMRYQGYPWEVSSYADFLAYVRRTGVRYVEIGSLEVSHVPGLAEACRADSLPGLYKIYEAPEIALYRVR